MAAISASDLIDTIGSDCTHIDKKEKQHANERCVTHIRARRVNR